MFKVQSTLKMYKVFKYITDEGKQGVLTLSQKRDIEELDEQLAAILLACMEEAIWDKFRKCSTASQLWKELHATFGKVTYIRAATLKAQFWNIPLKQGRKVPDYIREKKQLWNIFSRPSMR
jgi:hypothetical protein